MKDISKIKLICQTCNKEFFVYPCELRKAEKRGMRRCFCGRKCYGEFLSNHQLGVNNHRWLNNFKKCLTCGKEFKPRSKETKFCSHKCHGSFKSKMQSKIVQCVICGKKKKIVFANLKTKSTCSRKCANQLHSQRMTGKGNSNWLNGIGNLPYEWKFNNKLKQKIRARDGFGCRLCGKTTELRHGCGLAIHHIDYNKQNNKENNLIALCNRCHGFTHYNREKWKKELSSLLEK